MVIVASVSLRFYVEAVARIGTFLLIPTPPKIPSNYDSASPLESKHLLV
jgi:hypothetical protein